MPTVGKIKEAAGIIGEKHDLKFIILYGSLAHGRVKEDSDIDIAVYGKAVLGFGEIVEIVNKFIDLLKQNEIDVKSLHHTDPLFRYQVTKGGILLYGDERDYVSYKIYAFRDYVDSKSLFVLKEKLVKKQLEAL